MKTLSKFLNYLILVLIFAYALFYYFENKKNEIKQSSTAYAAPAKSVDVDQIVNKYMKQTADQMVRDQLNSQIKLQQQLKQPIQIKNKVVEVKPEDVPVDQQIIKESQLQANAAENLKMQQEMIANQKLQEEFEKKEFARKYIENARQDGYHVILSPDLKVISITPIRKPSQDQDAVELFPAE